MQLIRPVIIVVFRPLLQVYLSSGVANLQTLMDSR